MRLIRIGALLVAAALFAGCGSGGSSASSAGGGGNGGGGAGTTLNEMAVKVEGSTYINKPTVSVTVCTPDQSSCRTVDNILLDTGSYGFRIFKEALSGLPLTPSKSGQLAECIQYVDGSADWGPVVNATLILGNEPGVKLPIQLIDDTFASVPLSCGEPDKRPQEAGFNGIMGIGMFAQDCGPACAQSPNIGIYFTCSGSTCTPTKASLSKQVQNPVTLLPTDHNGVVLKLPQVPSGGAKSVDGTLVFGIGTRDNNVPIGVTTFPANNVGRFQTSYAVNGAPVESFIDSGSNAYFFTPPSGWSLPDCPSPNDIWFCPPSTQGFLAINIGSDGSQHGDVSFQVGNFNSLHNSGNGVFNNVAGDGAGGFDWGLPFFLGRDVYVGMEGATSSIGSGQYWAY